MSDTGPIVLPLIHLKSDAQRAQERAQAEAAREAERDALSDSQRARIEEWESLSYTDQLHYSIDHLPSDDSDQVVPSAHSPSR